jgi:Domain of unknown function (DUF3560).
MAGRVDFEERKQSKIDRLNDAACKASRESDSAIKRSHDLIKDIPFGQPNIRGALTGTMNKSRNAADRSIKLSEKSDYYSDKAESAENNKAISSDDPNSIVKLEEKIAMLSDKQTNMKKVNAYYRKHKTCVGCDGVDYETAKKLEESMKTAYSWETAPYPSYELTSINAKIKAANERIAKLQAIENMPAEIIAFNGGEIISDSVINRIQIVFDNPVDENMKQSLKSHGFKWAPSEKAWQRLRSKNALYSAKYILKELI